MSAILEKNLESVYLDGNTILEKDFKNTVLTEMLEIHIIELPKVKRLMGLKDIMPSNKSFTRWIVTRQRI